MYICVESLFPNLHLSLTYVAYLTITGSGHRVRIKRDVSCSWMFVPSESAKKGNYI